MRAWPAVVLLVVAAGALFASRRWLEPRPASLAPVGERAAEQRTTPEEVEEPTPPPPVRELHPRVNDGESVLVELIEDPAGKYGGAEPTEADQVYGALVTSLRLPGVVYDPNLGHAARELAYVQSVVGTVVPADVLDFLLRSGGAPDKTVLQAFAQTNDASGDPLEPIRKRVIELVKDGEGVHRVGIGEAFLPGARLGRTIAVLVSNRSVLLNPAPRQAQRGTKWVLSGTLPSEYRDTRGLVLRPSGAMDDVEVKGDLQDARKFTLIVPTGDEAGTLIVSVIATGPHGPGPLAQVPVYVDIPIPTTLTATMPTTEVLASNDEAEALGFRLLNEDRARFGLSALKRDQRLDAVAREHSRDMRDNGWFGHWSEMTGAPEDRLIAAGYRAAGHAENVASARTIRGAQSGLLDSLGHRRNILTTDLSHVGIGVVGKREGDAVQWYLTQLFSRPVEDLDIGRAEAAILRRIGEQRGSTGNVLARDGRLDQLALSAAQTAAAGGNDDMATDLMNAAKRAGETKRGAFAWVQVVAEVEQAKLPEQAGNQDFDRIGLAVVQLEDHPSGIVGIALLLAGPR